MNPTIDKKFFKEKKSLSTDVAIYIKEQILIGKLNPGDRIIESQLAKELGISHTPIREALRQLSGEGVLRIVSNRGAQVNTLSEKDIYEIYTTRAVLEGLAIRLAVKNATDRELNELIKHYEKMKEKVYNPNIQSLSEDSDFIHRYIYKLSRHSRLMSLYDSISFQVELVNRRLGNEYSKEKEVEEHHELIEVIRKRDTDHAEQVMRNHIYRSYCEFIKLKDAKLKKDFWI